MHLFLAVLGGRSRGCHIEQHDVRFVAGARIEDTLPELRRQWFGLQRGLHLDSWQRIERVDGWRVQLQREPFSGPERLWFVNVGAYDPDCPWELHAFGLFVAPSTAAASARAKRHLLVGAAQQHKDDVSALTGRALTGRTQADLMQTACTRHPPAPTPEGGPGVSGEAEVDDVLALDRLGRWHVHLLPPEPGAAPAERAWQSLKPDWYGYRRLDRAESD